jgi:hypothetical protein
LNTFPQLAEVAANIDAAFAGLPALPAEPIEQPEHPRFTDVEVLLLQKLSRLEFDFGTSLSEAEEEIAQALRAEKLVWLSERTTWPYRIWNITGDGREALEEFYSTQQESARSA